MRIRKINLNQFKRFTELEINLGNNPKKIIVMVGPNGCGKSSIFDAFEEITKNYKGSVGSLKPEFYSKTFFTEDSVNQYNKNNSIKIINDSGNSVFNKKSFYIRSSYRFVPRFNIQNIRQLPESIEDNKRPASSIDIDSRLQENYERLIGQLINEFENGNKTGKQWKEEFVNKINKILKKILSIEISSIGNIVNGKGQLYFRKGTSKDFPYENLSSGEKEIIDIILDLIIKVKDFNDTIFCIDEPELHINTSIQKKLLIEIEKLIPDSCQLWIGTHSIGFMRALQEESLKEKVQVLNFAEFDFDTKVNISPIKLTHQSYKNIFQTALDDLTELISPETIIYCEGKDKPDMNGNDKGFDAEIYNKIFQKKYPNILFVSSGGNTEIEKYSEIALKVLNKALKNVKILRLKDKDIMPNGNTSNTDRENFLNESNLNRMLKRKEIENYIMDKSVLIEYCTSKELVFDEERYDNLVDDISTFSIKDNISKIKEICNCEKHNYSNHSFLCDCTDFILENTDIFKELEEVLGFKS